MVRFKPKLEDRKMVAKEQFDSSPKSKEDIKKILEDALKAGEIEGEILCINPKNINYEQISKDKNTNDSSHIVFLQFVEGGHVAVLGAGKDISFSQKASLTGTWSIISAIEGVRWKTDEVIVIPIKGLKGIGIKNVDNVLKCRNGVEHYLGKYLCDHNVPILNYYQHINYSDEFWKKCIKNNYRLKIES